ncbi:MAG: hypothetical protein QY328_02495 [Anaerolineales bacterium]|nr:MAG: hypothetical protein QY328_02495 [Anaerolineales bacterium]
MQKLIRIFSALTVVSGIAAFAYLTSLPGEGLSPFRLASLAGILSVAIASAFVFFTFRSAELTERLTAWIQRWKPAVLLSFLSFAFAWIAWLAVLYKDLWILHFSEALYERSVPVLLIGALTGFQAGIVFLIPHLDKKNLAPSSKSVWRTSLFLAAGFFLLAIFIAATKIGITYDIVGLNWGPAGVPISFAQVNLVLAIGFLFTFAMALIRKNAVLMDMRWLVRLDVIVFAGLWMAAVMLWSAQTISPSHFSPAVSAPNFEYYPYSDAALFDKASYRFFTGVGLGENLIRRPLYAGLLALFHMIGGVTHEGTMSVQILFLALIPALIYLLTAKLSNRFAGFLAGGFVILREANAIELSGKIATSHAKLMMSDLPAMLGIVALVFACIVLFARSKQDKWLLLVTGGILGLTVLVRAQSLILLPLILLLLLFHQKFSKPAFIQSTFLVLGLAAVITPWAIRNWIVTGSPSLGDGGEKVLMARNYSFQVTEYPQPLPGETSDEFSDRLTDQILTHILQHPGDVAFFVSNHFLRSLATSAVFIAPVYSADTPESLVGNYPFWGDWNGTLPGGTLIPLAVNFVILSFGIGLAQAGGKRIGWYPLLFFIVYQAGNAIARTSGWRFSLPIDWVVIVYYCIALSYLPYKLSFADDNPTKTESGSTRPSRLYPTIFLILFAAGILLPLAGQFAPQQDFAPLTDEASQTLLERDLSTSSQFSEFLEQENAVIISGIALYPRYFRPNGNVYIAEMPQDFRYLHFWLLHDHDSQIVLPRERPPDFFPHASTVTVIGCEDGNHISAWAVILHVETGKEIVLQEPVPPLTCP